MVTRDELQDALSLGYESRSFEVKGPGDLSDNVFCAKVARAVMAIGNLRDGGLVCIGVDENHMANAAPGLSGEQLQAWSNYDDVTDKLARFSDPPVSFNVQPMTMENGVSIVVLDIQEFDHVPHVCKRDSQGVLQKGMTYVRPRGKPESVPVPSYLEMRELLDLATTKGVRDFVARANAAGILLRDHQSVEEVDREGFIREFNEAWGDPSPVLQEMLSFAHSDVAIRPGPFDANRLDPAHLVSFLEERTVRLRGWPVPYIDHRIQPERHGHWIGQTVEPQRVPHAEAWRICTSGQFLHRRVLATDLRESHELEPYDDQATGAVAVWDVLLYFVEIAELGARFAETLECEVITFDVALRGIAGRQLISGDQRRELHASYLVQADALFASLAIQTRELIANPRVTGVKLTQDILVQFGLQLPDSVLMDWQDGILKG